MRGNVLNKKGTYNRCKLTRMVVDSEWEEQVWKEAWAPRVVTAEEESVGEANRAKRKESALGGKKRIKLDSESMWGEVGTKGEEDRANFLYAETAKPHELPKRQAKIKLLSGQEWLCNSLIKELVGDVVDIMELVAGTEVWEEWDLPQPDEQVENRRTQK